MHNQATTSELSETSQGEATTGLRLSALNPRPESPEEELARRFREEIDAQFATAPEPRTTGRDARAERPPGFNLSALRGEQDSPAQQAARAALPAAGPAGTGASAIARALADAHGTTRQTVVGWLKAWVEDGTAVRVGEGTNDRYIHRQHAPDS
ncbi:hypothetical protein RKD19_004333 [Streptomyces canus]|uniref:hypothetical protein n=1 Tax=unclassified Streptomyces TaxID=2593676 RepID=UPI0037970930